MVNIALVSYPLGTYHTCSGTHEKLNCMKVQNISNTYIIFSNAHILPHTVLQIDYAWGKRRCGTSDADLFLQQSSHNSVSKTEK